MKLADLKRLPVGMKLRIIHSLMGPCNKARVVARVQSNAILFTGDGVKDGDVSYLWFPKASKFRSDANGFTILEDGKVAAQYVFEDGVK